MTGMHSLAAASKSITDWYAANTPSNAYAFAYESKHTLGCVVGNLILPGMIRQDDTHRGNIMDLFKRLEFALLPHTIDQSYSERAEAVDRLWNSFVSEYLKEFANQHVVDGEYQAQTILSKHYLATNLKQHWFKPRALKGHKIIRGINDSDFAWFDMKPNTHEVLAELFDAMLLKVERLIHEDSVYFYSWSRDCDQCESDNITRFDSWYDAAQWITSFYDGLEGPGHVTQVTLKQYLTFEQSVRDHRAEQYNY